jgi:hypothetical protein
MLVLIAGITGTLGQFLAKEALSRGLSVRGLGRNPSKLPADLSSKLESFITSQTYYDIPALDLAVHGVDAVICAYAPSALMDTDAHLLLLRAAERANIKIFVASCWNNDWSVMKFGEHEHYDGHIAFEKHVVMTSTINPIYVFTGMFGDYLYTSYSSAEFSFTNGTPKIEFWGHADEYKFPWTAQEDVAAYTIEIMLNEKGVQEGAGGMFRVQSGAHDYYELAKAYEDVTGTKMDVVRKGTEKELEELLAKERKEKGRKRYFEYMGLASELAGAKGQWEYKDYTDLSHVRMPVSLHELVKKQFG